ncbi:DJ-1/PfpI family protein [Acidovorax sp. SDU_ACID1]|uniref:DJ-1/PfpI family protein n=1 Tax=Acidovorax sp. SDU_ACID1 TaxID=3136632 RepID=UPI0038739FFF
MTTISLLVHDGFADLDVFIPLDVLNRVNAKDWNVNIVGTAPVHRSKLGVAVETNAGLDAIASSDVVLIAGGLGSRNCLQSPEFMNALRFAPDRQLIGSQCSGVLILAKTGMLQGHSATTTKSAKGELQSMGIEVLDQPFVSHGNVATAGGCLAALYLASWVLYRLAGVSEARRALDQMLPDGESDFFLDKIEAVVLREGCDPEL